MDFCWAVDLAGAQYKGKVDPEEVYMVQLTCV